MGFFRNAFKLGGHRCGTGPSTANVAQELLAGTTTVKDPGAAFVLRLHRLISQNYHVWVITKAIYNFPSFCFYSHASREQKQWWATKMVVYMVGRSPAYLPLVCMKWGSPDFSQWIGTSEDGGREKRSLRKLWAILNLSDSKQSCDVTHPCSR